jgi:hypothetical protein
MRRGPASFELKALKGGIDALRYDVVTETMYVVSPKDSVVSIDGDDRRRHFPAPCAIQAPVNSANSVGRDIENGQLQVRLIRVNAIYLMEMGVIAP